METMGNMNIFIKFSKDKCMNSTDFVIAMMDEITEGSEGKALEKMRNRGWFWACLNSSMNGISKVCQQEEERHRIWNQKKNK